MLKRMAAMAIASALFIGSAGMAQAEPSKAVGLANGWTKITPWSCGTTSDAGNFIAYADSSGKKYVTTGLPALVIPLSVLCATGGSWYVYVTSGQWTSTSYSPPR